MAKMTDDTLLKHLQINEDDAAQYVDTVGIQRLASMREYYREPYPGDDALEGWSSIVTSEVQDTVEWILPELLDVFTTSDQAVVFEPSGQEDVEGAAQATDACNYVFYKQNNGFLCLYTAFKDALISQNCAVMWWKAREEVRDVQTLQGATPEMLAMVEADGYKIEKATPIMGAALPMYNAQVSRLIPKNKVCVTAFPPEELVIKRNWPTPLLEDCPYVARVMQVTLSDLRKMGYTKVTAADLAASDNQQGDDLEEDYREERVGGWYQENGDETDAEDESLTTGWLRIEYVLVDYDGDGIAERRVIYRLADKILSNEETDHVQIATTSPMINPHRWDGLSIAEVVSDIQRLKTDLTRAMVNGANLAVNPRKTVLTDLNGAPYVDIDDLLDYRVGGIIRQTRPDALSVEQTPFNASAVLPVLAYVDDMAEKRTGVSKQQQGLDSNALRNDRTAAEVMMTANAAKQRVKLIARIFAETLVKPVFLGILKLLTSGDMEALSFRLRGKFVQYDPNEWRDQYDMTVNVGLGTGDKPQQIAFFQSLMQMQLNLAQTPYGQLMIDPQKVYNTVAKIVELGGQKNVNDFVTNPDGRPIQPPGPPPQLALEQAKMQQAMQMKQLDMQADAQKFQAQYQLDMQKLQLQAEAKQRETQMQLELQAENDRRDAEREAMKATYEAQLEKQRLELEAYKINTDNQTRITVAQIAKMDAGAAMEVDMPGQAPAPKPHDIMAQAVAMLADSMSKPKQVIRDQNGKIIGVQ